MPLSKRQNQRPFCESIYKYCNNCVLGCAIHPDSGRQHRIRYKMTVTYKAQTGNGPDYLQASATSNRFISRKFPPI